MKSLVNSIGFIDTLIRYRVLTSCDSLPEKDTLVQFIIIQSRVLTGCVIMCTLPLGQLYIYISCVVIILYFRYKPYACLTV